jgi:hypothetical protein
LRQLSQIASFQVYILDYPEDYEISPLLQELHDSGVEVAHAIIPSNSHHLRHHWALRAFHSSLTCGTLDMLILDEDFTPWSRYFLDAARSRNATVVGLQKEFPLNFLGAYEHAIGSVSPKDALTKKLLRLLRQPYRIVAVLSGRYARLKRSFRIIVNYWLLPRIFLGKGLEAPGPLEARTGFVSTQVDAAIVYSITLKNALQFFFPRLNVKVAQHPLARNCRCNGREPKTNLLVTLSGPWSVWSRLGNSPESIERRWRDAILTAMALREFRDVDIRPHPAETEEYPYRLAESLCASGVKARVTDAKTQSIPEIICDYAGVIGGPSNALAEARASCKTGFVICLQDVEDYERSPSMRFVLDGITLKTRFSDLTVDDFSPSPIADEIVPTVCDVLTRFMAERVHLSR